MNPLKDAVAYAKLVKIEHTLFALPFALSALCLAKLESVSFGIGKIILCVAAFTAARAAAMGFNGARLHEKVFEERFLYHCDRMGYMVWGEYPNWGLDHTYADSIYSVLPEWLDEVERDFNHPSIITWVPLNESWGVDRILTDKRMQRAAEMLY